MTFFCPKCLYHFLMHSFLVHEEKYVKGIWTHNAYTYTSYSTFGKWLYENRQFTWIGIWAYLVMYGKCTQVSRLLGCILLWQLILFLFHSNPRHPTCVCTVTILCEVISIYHAFVFRINPVSWAHPEIGNMHTSGGGMHLLRKKNHKKR